MEIDNGNTSIYLNHLDEVKLIHEINKNEEKSKKKDFLNIILIIGAIILVSAAVIVFIFIKKSIRNKDIKNVEINNDNIKFPSRNKKEINEKFSKNTMIESSNTTKRTINSETNQFRQKKPKK